LCLQFDPNANTINLIQEIESRAGAAHLALSIDGKILAAANFGNGSTSYFDATGKDGRLTHLVDIDYNQFPPGGLAARQMQSNPHQHVPEGTGQYMLVNDLGEDRIHVMDVRNMSNIHLASSIKVGNATGPRHGVFYPPSAVVATQYIVANELSSTISVFNVTYLADTLELTLVQEILTFDPNNPPPLPPNGFQSTAGELIMNPNGLEVYVTNRLTGAPDDNFATFSVKPDGTLAFIKQDSSGGPVPRHISLGGVGGRSQAFVSNQNGNLAVLNVDEVTGLPNSGIITEIALNGPAYAIDITTVPIAGVVNR
jgi:6-phosphogluconolactonase (cycloisomerase 2 family)